METDATELDDQALDPELADVEPEVVDRQPDPDASGGDEEVKPLIAGRPTNLWLGLATAIVGALSVSAVALGADPAVVATLSGAWGGVVGAVILVVANQAPTVNPGDTINVTTPAGQPTYQTTIAQPPAQDPPPTPVADGGRP